MSTEPLLTRAWTAAELAALDASPLIRVAGRGARPDESLNRRQLVPGATRAGWDEIDVEGRRTRVAIGTDSS